MPRRRPWMADWRIACGRLSSADRDTDSWCWERTRRGAPCPPSFLTGAEFAPVRKDGGQGAPRLVRSQHQESVSRSALESLPQAIRQSAIQGRRLGIRSQYEPAMRSQAEGERRGV